MSNQPTTDLTDTLIAESFGDAATPTGEASYRITIPADAYRRGRLIGTKRFIGDDADDDDEITAMVINWLASRSDPLLFLDLSTAQCPGDVVTVEAAAWAGDWTGEDFANVREGRTVTLEIPLNR